MPIVPVTPTVIPPKIEEPVEVKVRPRRRMSPPALHEDIGTAQEGTIMVRLSAYGNETQREVKVPVPRFDGPTAKVRVSGGVTRNLGGFEFARMDVAVELPCLPNEVDLAQTYAYASDRVDEFLRYELGIGPAPIEDEQ